MRLHVITPKERVIDTEVQEVIVPGILGSMGFLPGHQELVSSLKAGELEYTDTSGKEHYLLLHGGFVEVLGDVVSVLADHLERPEEIDLDAVRKRMSELDVLVDNEESEKAKMELELLEAKQACAQRAS